MLANSKLDEKINQEVYNVTYYLFGLPITFMKTKYRKTSYIGLHTVYEEEKTEMTKHN